MQGLKFHLETKHITLVNRMAARDVVQSFGTFSVPALFIVQLPAS